MAVILAPKVPWLPKRCETAQAGGMVPPWRGGYKTRKVGQWNWDKATLGHRQ